ncbi:MAG: S-adenosyl-l-methionine hydroxide adenosyltransferase family protein, partial [Phycisphaerae bacterium]
MKARLTSISLLALVALVVLGTPGCAPAGRGIVALVTDYGEIDHYRGVLAANVLAANPRARIAEMTHNIEPFNIMQGAFVLAESVSEFPPGTVVVAVVDPGVGTARAPIVVETGGGRFIVGPDNGLLDLAIQREGTPRGVWRIENESLFRTGTVSSTFHGRDIFAPVGGHLSAGMSPNRVGPRVSEWVRLDIPKATRDPGGAAGTVTRIDYYGNCITNVPAMWMDEAPIGTPLTILVDGKP